MQLELIGKVLVLIAAANGAPVLAKKLAGGLLAYPLDGGRTGPNGHPLFGPSKTVRGILLSLLASAACAPAMGLSAAVGLRIGIGAMAGDLVSSFVKRRMGWASSSRASGLDQVPESLFPALLCKGPLALSVADVLSIVALFMVGEVLSSRLLYKLRIRDQPY